MNYVASLTQMLNLRKGEERVVGILLLYSFFQFAALALFFTTASAIFLTHYPVTSLPYVYIATCLLLLLLNVAYTKISGTWPVRKFVLVEVLILLLSICLFRIGFMYTQGVWLAFGLLVWHRILSTYVATGYTRLALLFFDIRQSKRLFGLLSSTEIPGSIFGYLLASSLVNRMGSSNILWASAGCMCIAFICMLIVTQKKQALDFFEQSETGSSGVLPPSKSIIDKFFSSRFILYLSLCCFIAALVFVSVEFAFLSQVNTKFTTQADITYFLGIILATGQFIAFFLKTFFYSYFQRKFGLRTLLFALPFSLVSILVASIPINFLAANTFLLLWIWVYMMLVHDVLKSAFYNNTFFSLLQALEKKTKLRVLDTLGNVEALSIGVSGLILYGLSTIESASLVHFGILLLVALSAWIPSIAMLNKKYILTLEIALKKRILGGSSLQVDDAQTRALLEGKLQSNYAGEVLYALNLLCTGESSHIENILKKVISHPSPEVRKAVLEKIKSLKLLSLLPLVKERIYQEESAKLKKKAIELYCFLGEAAVVEEISPYLDHSDELLQTGALVGLICFGGINGVIIAGNRLNEYIYSPVAQKRAFAADCIGQVGIRNFYHPLLKLLDDEEILVRKSALKAAGKINHPKLYVPMLRDVSSPKVFESAIHALIQTGEEIIPLFEHAFKEPDYNPARLRRLVYICGRIGGEKAIDLLRGQLYFKNIEVRNQILYSLSICGYKPVSQEKKQVVKTIHAELADAAWFLNAIETITTYATGIQTACHIPLIHALETELYHLKKRLLWLLSFMYDANDVLQVWHYLEAGTKEKKVNALEVLDVLIDKDLSSVILPLLEEYPLTQLVKIVNTRFPQPKLPVQVYLHKLINRQEFPIVNIWTQAITLYTTRQLSLTSLTDEVITAATHPNRLVAETALCTLQSLYPDRYTTYLATLATDNTDGKALTSFPLPELTYIPMTSTLLAVEKVMALKTAGIFSETTEDILVDIASILKEEHIKAGQAIFHKEDIGTCMYIIYEGAVKVHDGEHTLAQLRNRDFFGELSLLDTEPRSASVTALEDTFLLRLEQHAFYEVMASRTEVTREIMKILCRRLRQQNLLVTQLKSQLAMPQIKVDLY